MKIMSSAGRRAGLALASFLAFFSAVLPSFAAAPAMAPAAAPSANTATNGTTAAAKLASYKLQPMDLVRLQIYREPEMDRELRVSQDHTIVIPLIGVVDVRDRTIAQVQASITELYKKDYLVNPQVNLMVMEYASRTVNVLGAVNAPGAFPLPPERSITFLDAIARAGGFGRMANRNRVLLIRVMPDGTTGNIPIDADQMMGGDTASRWAIQDGDTILVPERLL